MAIGLCLTCHEQSDVTITVAVGEGRLAHYLACWEHIEDVCALLRAQTGHPRPVMPQARSGAVDAEVRPTAYVRMIGNHRPDR